MQNTLASRSARLRRPLSPGGAGPQGCCCCLGEYKTKDSIAPFLASRTYDDGCEIGASNPWQPSCWARSLAAMRVSSQVIVGSFFYFSFQSLDCQEGNRECSVELSKQQNMVVLFRLRSARALRSTLSSIAFLQAASLMLELSLIIDSASTTLLSDFVFNPTLILCFGAHLFIPFNLP